MRNAFYCITLILLVSLALTKDAPVVDKSPKVEMPAAAEVKVVPQMSMYSAFAQSFSSIIVSELGDKTFFIAAIMSMRYSRIAVLLGALLALLLMTIISTAFGSIVPVLLPAYITHIVITILFFFFGVKLLYDALTGGADDHDEQAEVEQELNQVHSKMVKSNMGNRKDAQIQYIGENPANPSVETVALNIPNDLESPSTIKKQSSDISKKLVFWQALTMTFLGEWGDRSQITTIALAAEANPLIVCTGSFLGHVVCTSLAVMGGKFLAKKISEKTVNICGGVLFLIFGVHNLFMHD